MDFEFWVKSIWGLITAGFWLWVNTMSGHIKELRKELFMLNEKLHNIEKHMDRQYQSKEDARIDKKEIIDLLKEIKGDLKEVNNKLDRKVDK